MENKRTDVAGVSSFTETTASQSLLTRREMLGLAGMAGAAALAGVVPNAVAQAAPRRPRIACLVSFWGLPTSHADWIINKLLDGYWWQGAHTPSRVEVVSVYIHQFDTSLLGQKVCKAKNIPIYKSVGEAVTLGGRELAVDGVVIVAEHGNYPTDLKGHWLLPRWWIYQQVVQVFENSRRSVPVFNDKHLSYNWDDAKWMFDKSRELNFPLTGGSSIPTYFRKPEIELPIETPLMNSIVVGSAPDEGAISHCIDVLQAFVDRRRGGETGVKSVQSIRGPETWQWVVSQYHAANAHEHWITEMMLTRKEPFNAERLLLSTGIVNNYMESNWEDGRYSAVGRRVMTPFMNMKYHSTHGPLFESGPLPPNTPFTRGFAS
jgi:hypothetical protein